MRAAAGFLAAVGLLAVGSPAFADTLAGIEGRYVIDPDSTVAFKVPQIGGGGISGRFMRFSGEFDLEPAAVGRSRVSFTLKPASVATGQKRVDDFLRSAAVFDTEAYPAITFRSSAVVRSGAESATVKGVLEAHGVTHPETFHVTLMRQEGPSVAFHVVGDVLRSRYGMDIGTPIYSNVVSFDMVIEGDRR